MKWSKTTFSFLHMNLGQKLDLNWPFSLTDESWPNKIGIGIFISPILANLSCLRLLHLISLIQTSFQKYMKNGVLAFFILFLGPFLGLISLLISKHVHHPSQLMRTFHGLEVFWDLGCCLLYVCMRIQIKLLLTRRKKKKNEPNFGEFWNLFCPFIRQVLDII